MSEAVKYASLVGRYIRMERPATADELAAEQPATIGMECTVTCVEDVPGGRVRVHSDYGYSFDIAPSEGWSFAAWADEETRRQGSLSVAPTECYCCSCAGTWDAACRNHGAHGVRPCRRHNLPGAACTCCDYDPTAVAP